MYVPPMGSGLAAAASLVDPAVKLKPIPRAILVQRLAADPFEQALHQVDWAAALAAIGAGFIRLQADDLISIYGFRLAVFAQVGRLRSQAEISMASHAHLAALITGCSSHGAGLQAAPPE